MARLFVFERAEAELGDVVEVCVLECTLLGKITAAHAEPPNVIYPATTELVIRVFAGRLEARVWIVHPSATDTSKPILIRLLMLA